MMTQPTLFLQEMTQDDGLLTLSHPDSLQEKRGEDGTLSSTLSRRGGRRMAQCPLQEKWADGDQPTSILSTGSEGSLLFAPREL